MRSKKVLTSLLILILGAVFLWVGSKAPTPIPTATIQPEATSSAVFGIEGEKVMVTKVRDGDTFEIEGGKAVRMIGVDTPETVDPRRPVGCFGKEASSTTKNLIFGKQVFLERDVSETDKYQRLLRYVYLPLADGELLFVNDYLVREGFAKVLTYPPDVKYNEQFREAEREARELKKGLWGGC